ncbi:MAG: LysM peptidoglycan-binding domain-containing protein [Myxococcales bacterium]|nr:LysM peptidoglycan-binding domain-containing protein [Myxococcales bacterium]
MLCLLLGSPAGALADRSYVVRPGDTLAEIARRFRTDVPSVRRANGLRGDSIRAGTRLSIPGRGSARAARRAGYHIVRRGDSLSRIARRHRVSVAELRRANRMRGDAVREGERLRIPGRRSENPMPRLAERAERSDQEPSRALAASLGLGTLRVAHALLSGSGPEPAWVQAAARAPAQIPPHAYGLGTPIEPEAEEASSAAAEEAEAPAAEAPMEPGAAGDPPSPGPEDAPEAGTLGAPLASGVFLRGWGSGAGGYHLALDLYAPPGTPVLAAERGIVAYEGEGLDGYGRIVLLLHPSGRTTAYAHNREILVVPGELVARGQIIARLGNTGVSRGPHLHFMLIDAAQHCDALPLLRPAIRWRDGRIVETQTATWTGARPPEIRCLPRAARPHPGTRPRRRAGRRRGRR